MFKLNIDSVLIRQYIHLKFVVSYSASLETIDFNWFSLVLHESFIMKKRLLFFACSFFFFLPISFSQAIISGHVFKDVNNDAVYQAGEGLNNITVWLLDLNAVAPYYRVSPVSTATSNASGLYTFNGVAAGDYQVRVAQSTVPATITRAVADNDAYPNGLTNVMGVNGSNIYSNIDFGFAATLTAPAFSSVRNFQWNTTNTFINQTSQTYSLAAETCGGFTYNPTITWSTDRTNVPGGGYGTNAYPQASYSGAIVGQDFPGNNKGGIHPADTTFQLLYGGGNYTSVNNDRQTTTIQFSDRVKNTKFSIYDIDHADPQTSTGRIDHIKLTGYNGANPVMPVLVNPSSVPWNTVSGNTVFGWADYPLNGYTAAYNSGNEDHGTINVYFQNAIDKIVIEYEEWAPVVLSGKGINDATPAYLATNEASWSPRTAPTVRGISIGSIDYTFDCLIILPANLISFTAISKDCKALLNWKTANEQSNFSFFEIESASDGTNFISTGKVYAKNLATGSNYSFTISQSNAKNYYRLKMTDLDGKYQYSSILPVNAPCNESTNCRLVSNPVKKGAAITVNLFITNAFLKWASLIVWDESGRKLFRKAIDMQPGQNQYSLNTDKFEKGTYFIGIYDADNQITGQMQKLYVR